MSWWRYRGQCTGRVIHFLYHYMGFDVAEHARVGSGEVTLHGQRVATFTWSERFGEKDVPEFTFTADGAIDCAKVQEAKREHAVLDALPDAPLAEGRKPVDVDALTAINVSMVRSSGLWSECVHKTRPVYFVANGVDGERVLWCKAGGALLYWSRDLAAWLRGHNEAQS